MFLLVNYCVCLQTQISLEKKELNILRTFGKSKLEKVSLVYVLVIDIVCMYVHCVVCVLVYCKCLY